MSGGVKLLSTAEPHLIPGYTGFSPQYRYRCGETYGSLTHKLLLDPSVNHAETLVLSKRTTDDYQVTRPPKNDIDIVNSRYKRTDPIYIHPTIPGYEGFVPNLNASSGQRYTVLATEGLAEFERQQIKNKEALNQLEKVIALQSGRGEPRSTKDRLLIESQFKLPMLTVRPDCAGVTRNLPVDEQCEVPRDHAPSPYFMDNANPKKYFVSRYAGHIPYGYAHFGATNVPATNSALCEFTSNYRQRQSTEWAPVTVTKPDPPLLIQPTEIYHKHVGMLPNYLGHVPGEIFRFGKTFGADTKDAKRWLRGDYSP
ncbi:hypothetical protein KPH14_008748 [Odynerus spinipes]|uniref:Ciliary microtubule inner protein 2A-C-like domain-containing protein n=1 Tax=Odynerus spinipes TaxID=1348599 RepID=A0AAD9R8V5_9HYME|nr:hypothetical protein KPH14_008748 [Odynerus spinipes]